MPTTTTPQARRLRADLAQLTDLAFGDLGIVWREFDSADAARTGLQDILPRLVEVYGVAAASLAADWYEELRDTDGVRGSFSPIVAELPADVGAEALAGYAVGPLFQKDQDWASALTLVQGGLQRRIANMSRATIMGSSVADPAATGWQRVGAGECKQGFCDLLIGRGAVYTEATANFAAHDHCKCSAVPAWGGREVPVKPFTPSLREATDADRARVRAYIASH